MAFNYSPKIVTNGLVLCLDAANTKSYPGSGTVWTDLSRGGNVGTLTNGPTFNSANGGSIVFDGTNDYVDIPYNLTQDIQKVTLSLWIQCGNTVSGNSPTIFGRTGGPNSPYKIRMAFPTVGATTPLFLQIYTNTFIVGPQITPGTNFALNTWVNLVFTYDFSNSTARFNNYINGVFFNSSTSGNNNITANASQGIEMMRSGADGSYRSGNIANALIYNRALSATEILQNYNATKGRFGL